MLGDVELTLACARELAKRIPPDTEAILTAETKGIPLAAALAEIAGFPRYFVARKSIKAYMENVFGQKTFPVPRMACKSSVSTVSMQRASKERKSCFSMMSSVPAAL